MRISRQIHRGNSSAAQGRFAWGYLWEVWKYSSLSGPLSILCDSDGLPLPKPQPQS